MARRRRGGEAKPTGIAPAVAPHLIFGQLSPFFVAPSLPFVFFFVYAALLFLFAEKEKRQNKKNKVHGGGAWHMDPEHKVPLPEQKAAQAKHSFLGFASKRQQVPKAKTTSLKKNVYIPPTRNQILPASDQTGNSCGGPPAAYPLNTSSGGLTSVWGV